VTHLSSTSEQRLAAARALLAQAGIHNARVSSEGAQQEIAVLEIDAPGVDTVAPLVGQLKHLGFRYVTIDLLGS
jgi:PP-loop superfamily ATP-utilizing enzyme